MIACRICSPVIFLFFGSFLLPALHVNVLKGVVVGASVTSDFGSKSSSRTGRRRKSHKVEPTSVVIPEENSNVSIPSSSSSPSSSTLSQISTTEADKEISSMTPSASTTDSGSDSHTMGSPESLKLKPRVVSLNIMVAGLAGLGKTTLCRALLDAWWREIEEKDALIETTENKKARGKGRLGFLTSSFSSPTSSAAATAPYTPGRPTVSTTAISPSAPFEYFDEKANTLLRVRIIDTPGFGNRVNHRNSVKPITDYISGCRRKRLRREQSPSCRASKASSSKTIIEHVDDDDNNRLLVHVCLYFLSPGRFLAIDRHFLKHVQDEVTIVPVIAKADTMTDDEIARYRAELTKIWKDESIDVYSLDERSNPSRNRKQKRGFGTPSSGTTNAADKNKFYRGRRSGEVLAIISRDGIYPWGHSCALDPEHSDLKLIRDSLLSEHTEQFLDLATAKYIAYRDAQIAKQSRSGTLKYIALVVLAAMQLGRIEVRGTTLSTAFSESFSVFAPVFRFLKSSPRLRSLFGSPEETLQGDSDTAKATLDKVSGNSNSVSEPRKSDKKPFLFGFFGNPSLDSKDEGGDTDVEPDNTLSEPPKRNKKPFSFRLFDKSSSDLAVNK